MTMPSVEPAIERRSARAPVSTIAAQDAPELIQGPVATEHAADTDTRGEHPAHLLVVDDHLDGLELVIAHLRQFDLAVSTAVTGGEALAVAGEQLPDLIILDVALPDLDGFQVLARLKQTPGTAPIPVLMLTGRREIEHKIRSFELGAADYLIKPVAQAELHVRVQAQLRQTRMHRALSAQLRTYERKFGPLKEVAAGEDAVGATTDRGQATDTALILSARQILRERLADPPSVRELARMVGTNQPRLSKGFRTLFGTTIYGFVRECRLARARELLAETKLPIKTIALEVGYSGTSDLTRAVRGRWGLTPTALRLQLQAPPES